MAVDTLKHAVPGCCLGGVKKARASSTTEVVMLFPGYVNSLLVFTSMLHWVLNSSFGFLVPWVWVKIKEMTVNVKGHMMKSEAS